jgi:hypothetical protein
MRRLNVSAYWVLRFCEGFAEVIRGGAFSGTL